MSSQSVEALETGRTLEVGGIRTHVHEAGEGPALLLLHGSGPGVSAWANWRPVLADLAQDFHVIAPDQVGFGETEAAPGGHYGRDLWTSHALALMDELGIERFRIVGNSMGGAVALSVAARRPDAVERLAVMGTVGTHREIPPALDRLWGYEPDLEEMREIVRLFAFDQSIVTDDLVRLRYELSLRPDTRASYEAMFPPPRQRAVDDLALDDDELAGIGCPTLVIHGYDDQIIPIEFSLQLMDALPDADAFFIGRCGHWVQIEQTAKFMEAVRSFMGASGRVRLPVEC